MRKRFNLTWRVVTALLLLLALVPALAVGVVTAAGSSDTTAPYLVSIAWIDNDASGTINLADDLVFYFSESMLTATLDTMGEVNDYLDSSATGAPPTAWDYGSTLSSCNWHASGTMLTVTLGTDCSTQLSSKTVGPKASIKDKAGISITSASATIPSAPDPSTYPPTLLSITWIDTLANGVYDAGDSVFLQFSEAMTVATIGTNINTELPISRTGASWGAGAPIIVWTASNTMAEIILAGVPNINTLGTADTMNPSQSVLDGKGNPDNTSGTGPSFPLGPDNTDPTLVSIGYIDNNPANPSIAPGDQLVFKWSEGMNTNIPADPVPGPWPVHSGVCPAGTLELLLLLSTASCTFGDPNIGPGTGTPPSISWTSGSLLTVTLGTPDPGLATVLPLGGVTTVIPANTVVDGIGNSDGTTGAGPTIPGTATTVTKETTKPSLRSICWDDADANGMINTGDDLIFNFDESITTSLIDTVGEVNARLDSSAPGSSDYGTESTGGVAWTGDTVMTITLGDDCSTQLGGINNAGAKTVTPATSITDKAGNAINTTAVTVPLAPDTLAPVLLGITWEDIDGNGEVNAADHIIFDFSEEMAAPPADANVQLDSSAIGAFDYGPGVVAVGAGIVTSQYLVHIFAPPAAQLNGLVGCTVNPSSIITDAKGNPDGTVGNGPAIPLPPDKIQPTLVRIVWTDTDINGLMNQGDLLIFGFSESINPATIDAGGGVTDVNVGLDSSAPGATDFGTTPPADYLISWDPSFTELTVTLGTGEGVDGGEWVNPTDVVTDMIGNIDHTLSAGVQIPNVSGTPPTIVRTPATLTFTATINGSNPVDQTVSISNSGAQALAWSVSKTAAWLTISPASGNNSGTVTCSVNISGLAVGSFSDTITITASGATNTPQTVPVTLTITVPATPTPTATTNATPTATANVTPTPTVTVSPTVTPTPTATTTPGTSGSATIPTTGGTVASGDGKVEVTFPSGAFTSSTTVTIASASCHPDTDAFVVGSTCFSVTPGGALGAEATICVELSSYDLSLGDEGDLTLGYWSDGEWHAVSSEINGNTICGTTNHLSDWAVLSSTGGGWLWWYWALIGGGAFIVVLAIILLLVLPKKGKGEEIPSEELYGEEEEEF